MAIAAMAVKSHPRRGPFYRYSFEIFNCALVYDANCIYDIVHRRETKPFYLAVIHKYHSGTFCR